MAAATPTRPRSFETIIPGVKGITYTFLEDHREVLSFEFADQKVRAVVEGVFYPTGQDYWRHNTLISALPCTLAGLLERATVCIELSPSEQPLSERVRAVIEQMEKGYKNAPPTYTVLFTEGPLRESPVEEFSPPGSF